MLPKKNRIEEARKNGTMDRLNMLLSATQPLMSESSNLFEEATDMMKAQGIMVGRLKQLHNDVLKAYDKFFTEFGIHITNEEQTRKMFQDLEAFDKSYRKWACIEAGWKPKKIEK